MSMIVCDMHCDSLTYAPSSGALVNRYNFSDKYSQLQLSALFIRKNGRSSDEMRDELMARARRFESACRRFSVKPVFDRRDLDALEGERVRCAMLTLEGGGGLTADPHTLSLLYRFGLRVMSFAWEGTKLCASSRDRDDYGLTDAGRALTKECERIGITVDVSHISDRAFYGILEETESAVIATHSNLRAVVPSPRNLTDGMAREIARRGGVIGLNLYPPFLSGDSKATEYDIIKQVDHALSLLGDGCLGFGFDIDGVGENYPDFLSKERSMHDRVIEMLLREYPTVTVERISGKNVYEFFKRQMKVEGCDL